MTGSNGSDRCPGTALLKIARLLISPHVLSTVVQPTISDLQREVADAGHDRAARARARWRGYRAFWAVMLVVPFAAWPDAQGADGAASPDAITRLALASIVLALLGLVGPVVGSRVTLLAAAAGAVVAALIHRWYARHPSHIPTPTERRIWSPQINFSSTEVAGNIGGLIFAVGSVFIVVVGVPSVIWFLFAGTAAGCVVAWALIAWHTKHPTSGLPANRIVWR